MQDRSEFYIPNVINYVRIFIVILMLLKIRTRPISAFILCLVSGFIDSIDGDLARNLNQKSKLGYLMDMSLDRLTNSAQMVTLALFYPNYWLVFFTVQSVDTIRDFCKSVLEYQHFLVNSVIDKLSGDQIKTDIYKKLEIENLILNEQITKSEDFNLENFLILQFYHYVWYSSDFYFWLLYFNAFITDKSINPFSKSDNLPNQIKDINNNQIISASTKTKDVILLKPLERFFIRKSEKFLNNFHVNNFLKKIINYFSRFFQLMSYFLFFGAILKFYFNLKDLLNVLYCVVNNDNRLQNFVLYNK